MIDRTPATSPSRAPAPTAAKARRSSMSRRVTPGSRPTAGSTSRGTAMSTISSGRPCRRLHGRRELVGLEERGGGTGGGEQHVDVGERVGEVAEADGSAAGALGQRDGGVPGAVGDHEVGARLGEAEGHGLAHVAGAEHEGGAAAEPAEAVGRHGDGGLGDRGDVAADGGVGAGALAGLERVAEEEVEGGAGGALLAGALPRLLDLPEDLALAEHGRVEAGGHREEVRDGRRVVVDVEVVAEVLGREERDLGEEVADVLVGAVEALRDGVDLGAVAGGQHHGLGHVGAGDEVVQRLGQRGVADGHALEEVERRAAVVQPDDDDGHAVVSLRLRAREGRIGGVEGGSQELPGLVEAASPDEVQHPRIQGCSPIGGRGSTGPPRAARREPRRAARPACRPRRRPARPAGRAARRRGRGCDRRWTR